jgi:hypothetical protein
VELDDDRSDFRRKKRKVLVVRAWEADITTNATPGRRAARRRRDAEIDGTKENELSCESLGKSTSQLTFRTWSSTTTQRLNGLGCESLGQADLTTNVQNVELDDDAEVKRTWL